MVPPAGREAGEAGDCLASRSARPVSSRGRRLAVGFDDESPLKGRGATVHKAWTDGGMPLELRRKGFQEGASLHRMNRRRGGLNGVILVVGKAERRRHMGWKLRTSADDGARWAETSRGLSADPPPGWASSGKCAPDEDAHARICQAELGNFSH